MRSGRAIRGKKRILDGKEDKWSDLKFRAQRWLPRLCRLRPAKHLNVVTHTGHMESPNLVVSCATEIEAILSYLMGE
jgi:hypothetical protein